MLARVLAFVSVLLGGAASGLIGYAFADVGGLEGAAVGALTLRAFGEWETIRSRDERRGRA